MLDPHPGPWALLFRSPVELEEPIVIFFTTVTACFFNYYLVYEDVLREYLNVMRKDWNPARAPHWKDIVDRDMHLAQSILDDASHRSFLRGMRNRVLLRYLMLELAKIIYDSPPAPSEFGSNSASSSSALLDNKDGKDVENDSE